MSAAPRRPSLGRIGRTTLWLALAAAVGGCSFFMESAEKPVAAYTEQREVWTRHVEIYEDMESRAFAFATLKTEPFRRAWVDEYARIFALPESQKAELLTAELAELAESWVVMIAFATHEPSWNKLDPRAEIWELRLEDAEGHFVAPLKVETKKRGNPTWRRLYPHIGDQYTLYEARFPRTLPSGEPLAGPGDDVHLVIAGAPAQIKMSWKLP